ncbi:hypothetical protein FZ103_00070 [Streptomonospora sp. PA3]|uniref:sensor domain-containing protein n=1 Tax=Streptomonospora sp. PA3 TaxID=2607326 RepID=UPI0012DC1F74|nr:hypothetical protein [Streptomonospora sp. PA3]
MTRRGRAGAERVIGPPGAEWLHSTLARPATRGEVRSSACGKPAPLSEPQDRARGRSGAYTTAGRHPRASDRPDAAREDAGYGKDPAPPRHRYPLRPPLAPLSIVGFVIVVTGLALGAGLLPIAAGLVVAAVTLRAARVTAAVDRDWLPHVSVDPPTPPSFRSARAGAGAGAAARPATPLRCPQSWYTRSGRSCGCPRPRSPSRHRHLVVPRPRRAAVPALRLCDGAHSGQHDTGRADRSGPGVSPCLVGPSVVSGALACAPRPMARSAAPVRGAAIGPPLRPYSAGFAIIAERGPWRAWPLSPSGGPGGLGHDRRSGAQCRSRKAEEGVPPARAPQAPHHRAEGARGGSPVDCP